MRTTVLETLEKPHHVATEPDQISAGVQAMLDLLDRIPDGGLDRSYLSQILSEFGHVSIQIILDAIPEHGKSPLHISEQIVHRVDDGFGIAS